MRLGQLARKLEVRPTDIVEYLATLNVQIDNGTNTRLEPDHEKLAVQHFAPALVIGQVVDEMPETVREEIDDLPSAPSSVESIPENTGDPGMDKAEVIKAPKIELSGLKVLGKIELPDPKKKEAESSAEKSEPELPKDSGKERKFKEYRRQQRPSKNPIALRREQEAEEARKKREEEYRLQKERRTQNYLKKVKAPQQTKAVRIFKEETQQMSVSELQESPKTLWGRFIKWLTT
jgi:hypothetical protein